MTTTAPRDDPLWPRPSALKEAVAAGRPGLLAMWLTLPSSAIVEILSVTGIDAVIIDREHSSVGMETTEALIAAAERCGLAPLVRPTKADREEVSRLLDSGAAGIVFPMIGDGAEAERAKAMLRYPPAGSRGWGGSHTRRLRWTGPDLLRSAEYLEAADASLLSIFLIETPGAVAEIESILERGRPDAVIFGWGDFGVAVGFDSEATMAAAERVYAACRERGIGVARDPATPLAPDHYPGCFVVAGVDSTIIASAFAAHVASVGA